ncbi:general odorant-binding protein 56a-like [Armigeres subalbatus]|uniref:general odorant-binding protein 56a-like n=1 Tax=Armigeres subalbatus TaxID=124917 RepID=UPI002ECFBCCB
MLKLAVALLSVTIAVTQTKAFTLQQRQQGDMYAIECVAETGVNPASVAQLRVGDFTANDKRSKCFIRCFFEKEGFMDKKGNLHMEKIVDALSGDFSREKVETVLTSCSAKGKNACETAFRMYECFYKHREGL